MGSRDVGSYCSGYVRDRNRSWTMGTPKVTRETAAVLKCKYVKINQATSKVLKPEWVALQCELHFMQGGDCWFLGRGWADEGGEQEEV